jgi:2,3-bisphosphoglycerate-independent phosphoglycerate mutase
MSDANGEPFTAHTTNPVWLVLVDDVRKGVNLRKGGRLADIAPTMLRMLGLPKPKEMTGECLF